jgi:hypothetical protein
VTVSLVPTPHVRELWPRIRSHVERAAEYTHGRYTADDILTSITDYDHHLWIAFDNPSDIKGIVVTALKSYPRMRALDLVFIAGDNAIEWKDEMLHMLQCWAYDNDCDVVESSGRLGWGRALRDDGYKPLWQVYELPVGATGIGG